MKNNFSLLSNKYFHPSCDSRKIFFFCLLTLVFLGALYFRISGIFRGLGPQTSIFHPDEAKQILALFNFLNGDYTRYYGDLFYDGYPYGLNHLDEYLLRPLLFFLGAEPPDHFSLYYYARLLRVAYGMIIMIIAYKLVYSFIKNKNGALLATFLFAIAPLSITVSHFATGDIGVDLFTALCFLFLVFYLDKHNKKTWLFASGVAVGAAFSAKYNGLLVGIVPALLLSLEFIQNKNMQIFAIRCCALLAGTIIGIALFTPNLLLDFNTTISNIFANFNFIKNYNVPAEVLALSWTERAILGLKNNSLTIISSLGYTVFLSSILGLFVAGNKYFACRHSPKNPQCPQNLLIISIALFPIFSLFVSLIGKNIVQPFHFSYLQLPLIIVTCTLFPILYSSRSLLLKGCFIFIIVLIVCEFGRVSWKENFFWRLEDNAFIEKYLPASIFTAESFYTHNSDTLRSLYLEPPGSSVFRNFQLQAKGPDSKLWNTIEIAPLPQVPNPIGKNWIFLNGPTFLRNEKVIFIHGEGHGRTMKRYLVLPEGESTPAIGIRSGSYPTEVAINFGGATALIQLEAHQQKTIVLKPQKWKVQEPLTAGWGKVRIIPLKAFVPHDDIWLTILTTQKEKDLFALFGGGQSAAPPVPQKIPSALKDQYYSALSRLQYLEHSPGWKVAQGQRIPMWQVNLPAGRYHLTGDVEGLVEESAIAIELEDAKGTMYQQQKQTFQLKKGLQRIEYNFTKSFVPYQGRLVIRGLSGTSQIHKLKIFPDYQRLSDDFEMWRTSGTKPEWVSRFEKERLTTVEQ